jgi:PAS domain S-box-containing protein
MKDQSKTKQVLIQELASLRQRIQELEYSESERKRAEDALRESEEKYRAIIENMQEGYHEVDLKGNFTFFNESMRKIIGYEREELLGMNNRQYSDEESARKAYQVYNRVYRTGEPVKNFEWQIIRNDGDRRDIELSVSLIRDAGDHPTGFRGIVTDITDRKRAEKALTKSEEKFRKAFYTSPDSVNINRLEDGMYISINPGFTKIMGYTEEDIIGKTSVEYNIWGNIEDRQKLVAGLRKGGAVTNLQAAFRTKGGDIRYGLMSASVIDLNGIPHILSVTRDITEREQAEKALQRLEEKFFKAFDASPTLMAIRSRKDGRFINVNEEYIRVTGYSREELIGATSMALGITYSEIYERVRQTINEQGFVHNLETKLKTKTGDIRTGLFSAVSIEIEDEPCLLSAFQDITDRKQAEEALKLDEARLEALLRLNTMDDKSFNEIIDYALEEMIVLTKSEAGYLAFVNDDETVLTMHSWSKRAMEECQLRYNTMICPMEHTGLWAEPVRQRRPIITNDYDAPNPLKKDVPKRHFKLVRHAGVPFIDGNKVVMTTGMGNKSEDYNGSDVRQISLMMDGIWKIIQRRRVEETLRKYMSEQERALQISTALHELSAHLLLDRSLDENLQLIVNKAAEVFRTDTAYIALADDKKEKVRMYTLFGIKTKDFIEMEIPFGLGLGGHIMKSRSGLIIDDYFNNETIKLSPAISQIVKNEGVISGMGVPIQSETEDLGVLYVFHRQPKKFDTSELKALEMFGHLAALEITGKRRKEALFESESMYKTLAESSYAGVFIVQDGTFQFVNPHIMEYSGFSEKELIGRSPIAFVHPDDREMTQANAIEMLRGKRSIPYEYRVINRKGNIRRLMETVRSITYKGKRATLGSSMDITERYQMENILRQAQKMEAIGTLAGGIAHDFNNILSAIMGYTDMALTDRKADDPHRGYLEQVYKAGERARDLVKQILAFSRREEKEKKPVLVAPILKEGVKLLRSTLPATINIKQEIKDTSIMVLADPTQVHQVLMNLCTNAAHAMREKGGTLWIQLVREGIGSAGTSRPLNLTAGSYAKLTVSDSGHGIDASIVDRIFDPFFTTKLPGEGTGLGLSVVYGIVKDHGGEIDLSSELGKGTTVTVYFPLIQAEKPIEGRTPEDIPGGSERILFIDDEAALAELASVMLTSMGYQVTSRTSSVEALEAFRANPYGFDMVITDMTMPNIRGDHLAKELLKIRPDIPIIICTGFSEMISEDKAKNIGIREFIMKPINKKELAVAIRDALKPE